jgi:hypothetical protein
MFPFLAILWMLPAGRVRVPAALNTRLSYACRYFKLTIQNHRR